MSVFFFGMGYSARAAAQAIHALVDPAIAILGTTRSEEKRQSLGKEGVEAHLFNGTGPGPSVSDALRSARFVIHSIAPDETGDPVLLHHRADLDRAEKLEWLCYFSTVGVYGNADGGWIDEDAPCAPLNTRSRQRCRAEEAWRDYARSRGLPLLILRLAGIYGPGRSTFDKLRAGTARRIVKPGQVFNRIHVDDIGRVTALAMQHRLSGTFNLSDEEPAPPQDLVSFAAGLIGVPVPEDTPFDAANLTPMARSFYSDNKRVSSARIRAALGVDLLYPNYREGLRAIHAA